MLLVIDGVESPFRQASKVSPNGWPASTGGRTAATSGGGLS
jgi:hypothetical protein